MWFRAAIGVLAFYAGLWGTSGFASEIGERKRTAETPPRKVQHSFINADSKVTGDLESAPR